MSLAVDVRRFHVSGAPFSRSSQIAAPHSSTSFCAWRNLFSISLTCSCVIMTFFSSHRTCGNCNLRSNSYRPVMWRVKRAREVPIWRSRRLASYAVHVSFARTALALSVVALRGFHFADPLIEFQMSTFLQMPFTQTAVKISFSSHS